MKKVDMNTDYENFQKAVRRCKDKIKMSTGIERKVLDLELKKLMTSFEAERFSLLKIQQNSLSKFEEKITRAL